MVYYADDGSLSQDGLHFLTEVEKLLAAEGGRPHWGKYYDPQRYQWRAIIRSGMRFVQCVNSWIRRTALAMTMSRLCSID